MRVAIAGGHGKIALLMAQQLSRRGDEVVALIRNPDQADEVRGAGAEPVLVDLEREQAGTLADAIAGCDAVVFAAGAGPGSGAERKETVDYAAAVELIAAAIRSGRPRYLMISAIGADPDRPGDEVFDVYLRAKGRADAELARSGLPFTIVRPGRLTDDPPSGRVEVGERVERGPVSRADVAAAWSPVSTAPRPPSAAASSWSRARCRSPRRSAPSRYRVARGPGPGPFGHVARRPSPT